MWVFEFYCKPIYAYQCWLFNITSDENKLSTLFFLQHSKMVFIFIKKQCCCAHKTISN